MNKISIFIVFCIIFQINNSLSQNLFNLKECHVNIYNSDDAEDIKDLIPHNNEVIKMLKNEIYEIKFYDIMQMDKYINSEEYGTIIFYVDLFKWNIDINVKVYYGSVRMFVYRNLKDHRISESIISGGVFNDIIYSLFYNSSLNIIQNDLQTNFRILIKNFAKYYYKDN